MKLPLDIYLDDARELSTPSAYSPSESEGESSSSSFEQRPKKRKRTNNGLAKGRRRRSPSTGSDDSVYAVEHILARSISKWRNHDTKQTEHRYLVRWENYEPSLDTWEGRAGLMDGSEELVNAFDNLEYHPFKILSSRLNPSKPTAYLVRYGLVTPDIQPSPLFERKWHTAYQMTNLGRISKAAVRDSIKEFEASEQLRHKATVRGASPRPAQLQKTRCILAILEDEEQVENGRLEINLLVRWRDKMKIKLDWMSYEEIVMTFEEDGIEFVQKWRAAAGSSSRRSSLEKKGLKDTKTKSRIVVVVNDRERQTLSEYEMDRLKNIEANKELLKGLGLCS